MLCKQPAGKNLGKRGRAWDISHVRDITGGENLFACVGEHNCKLGITCVTLCVALS